MKKRITHSLRRILRTPWRMKAIRRNRRFQERDAVELAVGAIFRNEAIHLDEWLTFHQNVGVGHFYLYNNFSEDHYQHVLQPWVASGTVTLYDWPVKVGQFSAYRHCCRIHGDDCRWLALIDIDEFLFCPSGLDLRPTLREFEHLSGVEVWQRFFGSGGHVERPSLPVTEAYRWRAPDSQTTVKSIVNPRLVKRVCVHQSTFWSGASRDTSGQIVDSNALPTFDRLKIHHYWSRSIADLHEKVARGDASTAESRQLEQHLRFEESLNAIHDNTIESIAAQALSSKNDRRYRPSVYS